VEPFLGWLDHMEHDVFGIPRPDQIVYLEVPNAVRVALKQMAIDEGKHGANVQLDVAERNNEHQETTEERARSIVASKNNWDMVSCCTKDEIRSREEIHEDVYQIVSKIL